MTTKDNPKPTNMPPCPVCHEPAYVTLGYGYRNPNYWVVYCDSGGCPIGLSEETYTPEEWCAFATPRPWILLDPADKTTWPPESDADGNDPQVIFATYYDDPSYAGFDLSPDFSSARAMRKFMEDDNNKGYGLLGPDAHIWQLANLPNPATLKKENKDGSN